MFTNYASTVAASKIPNDFGTTGYCNTDLALSIFHIFHTVTNTKGMFGSWEMNDDQVTHLHLVFEHQGRVDTAKCNCDRFRLSAMLQFQRLYWNERGHFQICFVTTSNIRLSYLQPNRKCLMLLYMA